MKCECRKLYSNGESRSCVRRRLGFPCVRLVQAACFQRLEQRCQTQSMAEACHIRKTGYPAPFNCFFMSKFPSTVQCNIRFRSPPEMLSHVQHSKYCPMKYLVSITPQVLSHAQLPTHCPIKYPASISPPPPPPSAFQNPMSYENSFLWWCWILPLSRGPSNSRGTTERPPGIPETQLATHSTFLDFLSFSFALPKITNMEPDDLTVAKWSV